MRTSVQLPLQTIQYLDSWPFLNRSEVLRLIVERYSYLETAASQRAVAIVEKYRPAFTAALKDMSFQHFKVAATSLAPILTAALSNQEVRAAVEEQMRSCDLPKVDWDELFDIVAALDAVTRIRVLDYTLEEHYRDQEREP